MPELYYYCMGNKCKKLCPAPSLEEYALTYEGRELGDGRIPHVHCCRIERTNGLYFRGVPVVEPNGVVVFEVPRFNMKFHFEATLQPREDWGHILTWAGLLNCEDKLVFRFYLRETHEDSIKKWKP